MSSRRLIERYIFRTIYPFVLAALGLFTAILFVQQTVRYFELIFHGVMPAGFVYGLALALLPPVLLITIPMSVLSGTIIGYGRMNADSELVAMRAAGVSTWRTLWPALLIGAIATAATAYINLVEAPRAQSELRSLAVRSALYKLDSPVEPRTFTTDFPGYVIYVRDGDKAKGQWSRVFIQSQEADRSINLITARVGRIDSSSEKSELVLEDAMKTRVPAPEATDQSYVVERLKELRVVFNTGRAKLLERLNQRERNPDEMTLGELRRRVATSSGTAQREAYINLNRRWAFSLTPLIFSFFAAALALRLRRGSRGFGVLVSLLIMTAYYLTTLAGDQAARAGSVPPVVGAWFSTALTLGAGIVLLFARQRGFQLFRRRPTETENVPEADQKQTKRKFAGPLSIASFPNLMDTGILRTMVISFVVGFVALVLIFDIFTAFELWRFISASGAGAKVVAEYLFYLLPLVSIELFPGSVLVAVLLTYALIARRREAVAWWASGQSVYRLMLPGLAFALVIAAGAWFVQERLMPRANIRQDSLRARITGRVAQVAPGGERRWLVGTDGSRIYSYDFDDRRQVLLKPAIYEFDSQQIELKRVIKGEEGKWLGSNQFEITRADWINLDQPKVAHESAGQLQISGVDPPSTFKPTVDRPSQMDSVSLREYVRGLKRRGADTAVLAVALQRKYATPFTVIVMALIGMPLAISFGRRSLVIALCSAVVVSLAFWLISGGFQQLGEHALLPPAPAVWTPIVMFACGGLYLISRVRT